MKRRHDYDKVLTYIIEYKKEHGGLSPTMRRIGNACNISSSSVVSRILDILMEDGKISISDDGISIPGEHWSSPDESTDKYSIPGITSGEIMATAFVVRDGKTINREKLDDSDPESYPSLWQKKYGVPIYMAFENWRENLGKRE